MPSATRFRTGRPLNKSAQVHPLVARPLFRVPTPRSPLETFQPRDRLPGFRPSSRHHRRASTNARLHATLGTHSGRKAFARRAPGAPSSHARASRSSLRSVLGLSQPPDGLLRSPARGLVASRSHVQGPSRSGASLPAQPPSLIGRSYPLAVPVRPLTQPEPDVHGLTRRLRGFHPRKAASCRNGDQPPRHSLPSSRSLLQAPRSGRRPRLPGTLRS